MIYLIGGPPRCGKTTLAKTFSKQAKISWISADTLEVVAGEYMTQEDWDETHPYSIAHTSNNTFYAEFTAKEIIDLIKAQSLATEPAIHMTALCSIKDEIDYIIEGYHITPKFAAKLIKKYGAQNIKAVFLVKNDAEKFVTEAVKNPVANDWLIKESSWFYVAYGLAEDKFKQYYHSYTQSFTDKAEQLRIENAEKFSLTAMDTKLWGILDKYVPEFAVDCSKQQVFA